MILIVFLMTYGVISLTNDIFDLIKAKEAEKIRAKENEIKNRLV